MQAYAERHKKELLAAVNNTEPTIVCLVDVGASCAAAAVSSFQGMVGEVRIYV